MTRYPIMPPDIMAKMRYCEHSYIHGASEEMTPMYCCWKTHAKCVLYTWAECDKWRGHIPESER